MTSPLRSSVPSPESAPEWEQRSLWQRLTEPHPSIEEVGARHLARLLASFLLIATIAMVLGGPVLYVTTPAVLVMLPGSITVVVVAYVISRTARYRVGALMLVALCVIGPPLTVSITQPPEAVVVQYSYLTLMAILVGSPYLPTRVMVLVAGLTMVAVILVYAVGPGMAVETLINLLWLMLSFASTILVLDYHRGEIEQERLAVIDERRVELDKLNHNLETMLYVISHDLKEPLRAIQNFSRMVDKRYAEQLDDKGRDFLRRVVRGAERMRGLLDDIGQLSRAQRIEQPNAPTRGADIVALALGRLEERIKETGAQVRVAPDLPAFYIDKMWASGAIYNLVDNALKYTRTAQDRPEVEITAYDGPRGVGLVVKDRGPGVEPEHREKIFELFQRAVGRDVPGTGAGLAIVRQIADRHGGTAWVEPRPGGGSEFYITFQRPSSGHKR
ncbi:MAG: hypothetical protein KDK70_21395 [Myxococcales bacterium]|nr:hypothetical protein [Myxococcales bacterium]